MTWPEAFVQGDGEKELVTLLERLRGGSSGAFDELASRVRDRIRRWASRVTNDRDEAEDVAQLVLMRMHDQVSELLADSRTSGRFTYWLFRTTRNLAIDRYRQTRRRRTVSLGAELEIDARYATHPSADADHATDMRTMIEIMATELSDRQRAVFLLSDIEGYDSTEVSRMLGISPSTVRVHLVNARRSLRAKIMTAHPEIMEGLDQ